MKMDARPPVLAAERLTVQVGRRDVCHELDFTLQAGDTLVILGRNGAGKTTLLKLILGMFQAQSGTVRVFGLDPVENPVGTLGRIELGKTQFQIAFGDATTRAWNSRKQPAEPAPELHQRRVGNSCEQPEDTDSKPGRPMQRAQQAQTKRGCTGSHQPIMAGEADSAYAAQTTYTARP